MWRKWTGEWKPNRTWSARKTSCEEALVEFPGEPHFESALKLIRNRLSLVNSIVSKARFHEERGQFSEALGQWEILKTIHGKYPGLDFEMDRLRKRTDQQTRREAKAHWVEKIDSHLEASEFDKALEAVQSALQEFPDDPSCCPSRNRPPREWSARTRLEGV